MTSSTRTRSSWRRSFLAALFGLVALLGAAQPASAFEKSIWGPAQVNGVSQFPIYKDLGVTLLQRQVNWSAIATTQPADPSNPDDPAYDWAADPDLDFAVREGAASGIGILVLAWRTPAWANGGKPFTAPPNDPQQYAMFLEALAKRYPSIRHFMVWGEPIRTNNWELHPSDTRNYFKPGKRRKNDKLPSFTSDQRRDTRKYAELIDASYVRLKKLNRKNIVIGGNTTTSGDVDPFNWAKWLRVKSGAPPRMDFYGHNPFGTRGPDLKKKQILAGTADMSDMDVFVPWVKKYVSRSGRNKKLKIFISEYTAPVEVPSYEFSFYVTLKLQATWLTAASRIAKRDKSYAGFGWIGLYDMPKNAAGAESRTGLIAPDGKKRPSYYAFKRS